LLVIADTIGYDQSTMDSVGYDQLSVDIVKYIVVIHNIYIYIRIYIYTHRISYNIVKHPSRSVRTLMGVITMCVMLMAHLHSFIDELASGYLT
jgi:hypothetical protein